MNTDSTNALHGRYNLLRSLTVLLVVLALLAPVGVTPAHSSSSDRSHAAEGTTISNGKTSDTIAAFSGEVSVQYTNDAGGDTRYDSPDVTADTQVQHLSITRFTPDTAQVGVEPGDTASVAVRLRNRGNGPDTYSLTGDLKRHSWDTGIHFDVNGDSVLDDSEFKVSRSSNLVSFGDTYLLLTVAIPDTADLGSDTYTVSSQSLRTEDPEPGSDSVVVAVNVSDVGEITIDTPVNGYDTNQRLVRVAGSYSDADSGDSITLDVNGSDTMSTAVDASGSWAFDDVPLQDMGDTLRASLFYGDTKATIRDRDTITVNYDPIADTVPSDFGVREPGEDTVALGWTDFLTRPGYDPDTGTGFAEYTVFYDTGTLPDSTSTIWDSADASQMSSISTDTTIVTGLESGRTYGFRIAYRDRVGNVSQLSDGETVTVGTASKITMTAVRNTMTDSALVADGSGTIGIRVTWKNTGDRTGTLRLDADQLKFHESDGGFATGFSRSLRSDSVFSVPGHSSRSAVWWVDVPDTQTRDLIGNFEVSRLGSDTRTHVNIASKITDITITGSGIDAWRFDDNAIEVLAGKRNNKVLHNRKLMSSDGQMVMMVQRGDSSFIDTPLINPEYEFETRKEFYDAVESANKKMESTLNEPVGQTLTNISFWEGGVGDTYLGHAKDIYENFTVSMVKPSVSSDNLKVAKLLPEENKWHVIDENPEIEDGKIFFDVSSDQDITGSGFSVFKVVSGPQVSETKPASEAVVYPNPFVPFDGDKETGTYGTGEGDGIYFGTGVNSGFKAGTVLKVYTVTGELVVEKRTSEEGLIRWNAKTEMGNPVRSGVYVYRITTPDGSKKVGKLSIVR
ncbi:MAG: hypothetical protein ABEK50_08440 [bacterium]